MQIIRSVSDMQQKMITLSRECSIGFVATMGYFHDGHLDLMRTAAKDNDIVVTSIFVNPLQFGPNEDYDQYPRNEERDVQLAEEAGTTILFIPDVNEMYPVELAISLTLKQRTNVLCGRSRPGHFDGVVTVLTKLFHIVRPDRTYFGLKDAQQVAIVDALLTDLNFPIELKALPTTREHDGLAKSSRNVNLSADERNEAVWISKALEQGRELAVDGEENPAIIVKEVKNMIHRKTSGIIDYVELLTYPELQAVQSVDQRVILAAAVHFKKARLIDNVLFDRNGKLITSLQ